EAPVGRIAQRVTADYTDHAALEKFSSGLELVTYEFENVPVEAADFLAERVPVYPPPAALEAAQDRLAEKNLFRKLGIATTEFAARCVLESLQYVGVLALEFFEHQGELLVNEMAPRVHNSGHWTIEGAVTSQFENHLRAVLGLPLGSTGPVGHCAMLNLIGDL